MFVTVKVEPVAPEIFANEVLLSDDCHCTLPAAPVAVSTVLFAPGQTLAAPVIVPVAGKAVTVMVPVAFTLPPPPVSGME